MPPPASCSSPLILTLTLDKASSKLLTDLRSRYFPRHRNFLNAHVTLFHAIPLHRYDELDDKLNRICSDRKGWDVFIGEPQKMGNRGVMVNLRERPSNSTPQLHDELLRFLKRGVKEEKDRLTNQDLQPMKRPHVTVLNKAGGEEEVDKCLKEVEGIFDNMKQEGQSVGQHRGRAVGFELWEYLGGPWKPIKSYAFQGEDVTAEGEIKS